MDDNHPSKNRLQQFEWPAWIWVGGVFAFYLIQFKDIARAVLGALWPF